MVWKIVLISIAIVFASVIIGGAVIATQVLTSIPNFANDNSNVDPGLLNSGQDSSPAIEGAVRIVGDSGSNSYSPNPIEAKVGETVTWVNNDSLLPQLMELLILAYYKEGNHSAIHSIKKENIPTFVPFIQIWPAN
jgi:hypothetical protein